MYFFLLEISVCSNLLETSYRREDDFTCQSLNIQMIRKNKIGISYFIAVLEIFVIY